MPKFQRKAEANNELPTHADSCNAGTEERRIAVLLSTYNGAEYIRPQILSILAQLPRHGRIFLRDDGSSDATVDIVHDMLDSRISIIQGNNLGFVRSFFFLMNDVPTDFDIYMLADQDDIWSPDKVQRAAAWLELQGTTPSLYCSRLTLVDKDLHPLGLSPHYPRGPSFKNALTENIVTGCTAAMNAAALVLVRNGGNLNKIRFHDWWLYLVISAFGIVHYDAHPAILYRQHNSNSIGMQAGWRRYWTIVRYLRRHNWMLYMFEQAENLLETHGNSLSTEQRQHMESRFNRKRGRAIFRLLFSTARYRQTLQSDLLFRILLGYELFIGRGLK